jgi:parallel beta-helix repeat protein
MPTLTGRIGLTKYADLEPGWGQGISTDLDKIDALPVGHFYPRAQTTPNMTLQVASGVGYTGTTPIYFNGGNSPTFTAPVGNPRIDLLYLNSSGVLTIVQGTAAASPTPPTYPSSIVPIAEVYLRVGSTSIYDTDQAVGGYIYRDVRPVMRAPGGAGGVSGTHATGQSDVVGSVEIAAGSGMAVSQSGQIITLTNQGARGVQLSGGTVLDQGIVKLIGQDGVTIYEDVAQKLLRIVGTNPPAFANPMTTQGDLVYGGIGGLPTRLPIGSNGQVLALSGGVPQWTSPTTGKRAVSRTVASTSSIATSQAGADYVCDGTSDEAEIQTALNDVSTTGGSVILLEGTYTLSGQITIPSNVRLDARGATVKLRNSHNADINIVNIANSASNIEIVGLIVDGNKSNNSSGNQYGIVIGTNAVSIVLDRVWVQNCRNDCLRVNSGSMVRANHCYFTGSTLEGVNLQSASECLFSNCYLSGNNNGFYVVGATRCLFVGNYIRGHLNRNIFVGSGATDNQFASCYIYNSVLEGAYVDVASRTSFSGCKFMQNGIGANNTYAQLYVSGSAINTVAQGNDFYRGASGNLSKYGIWVATGATNTVAYPNAFPGGGGSTADVQNDGTGTTMAPNVSVQRSNSYVIAATDATTAQKSGADYVCDGTADDVEWQAALDLIHAANGGSILAVGKTFTFANPAQVGHNVYIEGDSTGTTIKWANSSGNNIALFQKRSALSSIDNFYLINITLDGNKANNTNTNQYGVNVASMNYPRFERVITQNFKSHGFFGSIAIQPFFLECRSLSNNGDGFNIGAVFPRMISCRAELNTGRGYYGVLSYGSLLNCAAVDNTTHSYVLDSCTGVSVIGAYAARASLSATAIGIDCFGCSTTTLVGCTVDHHNRAVLIENNSVGVEVLACNLDSSRAIEVANSHGTRIIGNSCIGYTIEEVLVSTSDQTLIEGNYFQGGSADVMKLTGATLTQIKNNHFYLYSARGIYVVSSSNNTQVDNNQFFFGTGTAIQVDSAESSSIRNNDIYSSNDYGIYCPNSINYITIQNNRVLNCEDGGIVIGAGGNNPKIENNYVRACGRSDYATVGDGIGISGVSVAIVRGNTVIENYGVGINVASSFDPCIENNTVTQGYQHGIKIGSVDGGRITDNFAHYNGRRTNATYDNIRLDNNVTNMFLDGNKCVVGINANKPRYGIYIDATCSDLALGANDYKGGGVTADFINNGLTVRRVGAFFGFTDIYAPPKASNWTWVNQGGATRTDYDGSLGLVVPADGTQFNLRALVMSLPSVPYTLEVCLAVDGSQENYMTSGVLVRESSTGKMISISNPLYNGTLAIDRWNSATSYNSSSFQAGSMNYRFWPQVWYKIVNDNTNHVFSLSSDGKNWRTVLTESKTAFLATNNQIGFFGNTGIGSKAMYVSLVSWRTY